MKKRGRPLKFKPDVLHDKIEAYFDECGIGLLGNPLSKTYIAPTISSLALSLNTTRDLLCDYEKRNEFSDTIKRAKLRIEAYNEYALHTNRNVAGVIFNLKNNFGWKDRAEVENKFSSDYEPVQIVLPHNGRDSIK